MLRSSMRVFLVFAGLLAACSGPGTSPVAPPQNSGLPGTTQSRNSRVPSSPYTFTLLQAPQPLFRDYGAAPPKIATASDGAIWYGGQSNSTFPAVRLMPGAGAKEFFFPTPYPSAEPFVPGDAATGSDGRIWFNDGDFFCGLGAITNAGTTTEYPIANTPYIGGCITSIGLGPNSNMWFVLRQTDPHNNLFAGYITPSGKSRRFQLNVPPVDFAFSQIVMGADGNLWTGGHNVLIRITPSGVATTFPTTANLFAYSVAAGPDGNIWYCGLLSYDNFICGRMNTSGHVVSTYTPPIPSKLYDLVAAPDGNMWITGTSNHGPFLLRATSSGTFTKFHLPNGAGDPGGITVGRDGNLYFTILNGSNGYNVGKFTLP